MIKIIEWKKPREDMSFMTGDCLLFPNYMVKDRKTYFVLNRREPDDEFGKRQTEERIANLKSNNGRFVKFHGIFNSPEEVFEFLEQKGYTFTECKEKVFHKITGVADSEPFYDFMGNFKEVSASFFFRIYDEGLAEEINIKTNKFIR